MEDVDETCKLTHEELLEVTKSSLCTLLSCDALTSELPPDVTLEEILSLIAVEHGQAITILIAREDETPLKVIVPQNATVKELKNAIERHFEIYQQRTGNKVKISWRYIWRTYNLNFDSLILEDDNSRIEHYGVTNKVILGFKKIKRKQKRQQNIYFNIKT